jgi:hypothetical protein
MIKFYIPHYTPLKERKINLLKQFKKHNITNFEFIETYDREDLNLVECNKFSNVKLSEISLFYKNVEIYKKATEEIIFILEDDAVLVDKFMEKIELYLKNLPKEWDIIFPGECCNQHVYSEPNNFFYQTYGARGTCLYMVNKKSAKKIIEIIDKENQITKPIDNWFDDMCRKYGLKIFWTEPTLVYQGSEIGLYDTSIR